MGLVLPPQNMLERDSERIKFVFSPQLIQTKENVNRGWEMFQSCFKESVLDDNNKDEEGTFHSICTLTAKFSLDDVNTEATMDNILLKLYDSLTPLDQYLIKCAAVLGEVIDRKMLDRLMLGTSKRDIGLCIVKLFELRILGCAVGDFSRGPGPALLFRKIHNPEIDIKIRCGCKGVDVLESHRDLPIYASCGLMRFKLDMFRETTYRCGKLDHRLRECFQPARCYGCRQLNVPIKNCTQCQQSGN